MKLPNIPLPDTLEKAKTISEFLLSELDDWVAAEYAKAQDRFEHQYAVLKEDWREGMYTLIDDMPGMLCTWYNEKIRWLLRSRGEIFLSMQKERISDIHRIQMDTIDAISAQWERWISEIREKRIS